MQPSPPLIYIGSWANATPQPSLERLAHELMQPLSSPPWIDEPSDHATPSFPPPLPPGRLVHGLMQALSFPFLWIFCTALMPFPCNQNNSIK